MQEVFDTVEVPCLWGFFICSGSLACNFTFYCVLEACGVGVNGIKEPGACSQYINLDAGGISWVKTFSVLLE